MACVRSNCASTYLTTGSIHSRNCSGTSPVNTWPPQVRSLESTTYRRATPVPRRVNKHQVAVNHLLFHSHLSPPQHLALVNLAPPAGIWPRRRIHLRELPRRARFGVPGPPFPRVAHGCRWIHMYNVLAHLYNAFDQARFPDSCAPLGSAHLNPQSHTRPLAAP